MPYVKISDPNIIDLAAWHQLINVVNQHSDSIAALTNNFGLAWNPDYSGDDWSSAFDFGSQVIVFGKALISAIPEESANTGIYQVYQHNVPFTTPFSGKPVMVGTLVTSVNTRRDCIITFDNVTVNDFSVYVYGLSESTTNLTLGVNWIAIGPK